MATLTITKIKGYAKKDAKDLTSIAIRNLRESTDDLLRMGEISKSQASFSSKDILEGASYLHHKFTKETDPDLMTEYAKRLLYMGISKKDLSTIKKIYDKEFDRAVNQIAKTYLSSKRHKGILKRWAGKISTKYKFSRYA